MIISRAEFHNVVNAYLRRIDGQSARRQGETPGSGGKKDSLSVSERALELNRLRARLANLAELRAHRVQELKKRIDGGEYAVTSEEIAEKILERVVADHLAKVAERE